MHFTVMSIIIYPIFCVMVMVVVLNLIQFIPTMMVENLLYTWINLVNLCRGLHIIIRQGY